MPKKYVDFLSSCKYELKGMISDYRDGSLPLRLLPLVIKRIILGCWMYNVTWPNEWEKHDKS
jgi:hypothetical protein